MTYLGSLNKAKEEHMETKYFAFTMTGISPPQAHSHHTQGIPQSAEAAGPVPGPSANTTPAHYHPHMPANNSSSPLIFVSIYCGFFTSVIMLCNC